jgi:hypothetical protein
MECFLCTAWTSRYPWFRENSGDQQFLAFRSVSDLDSSGSSILGWIPIRIRMQFLSRVFFWLKNEKTYSWKQILIFFSNIAIIYPLASLKDVQATGEAFSPQKRTSSTLKHESSLFFLFLWVIFALPDPDPLTSGSGTNHWYSGILIR